ncbi:hypothetical protein SS05631_c30940 [Sinorhizobium sp. CCBAU 05631]|nr:hypothetical protein SS05631_c30940 [Sinorhizobium sp. CCBAU 05631]
MILAASRFSLVQRPAIAINLARSTTGNRDCGQILAIFMGS